MSERLKQVGERVSDWAAHPLDAIVMCLLPGVAACVLSFLLLPSGFNLVVLPIGIGVSAALFGIYLALRRGGYLQEDVPFAFTSQAPYSLTVYRLVAVFIASRILQRRLSFSFPTLIEMGERIASLRTDDNKPVFYLSRSPVDSDQPGFDADQLRQTLKLFLEAHWLEHDGETYAVTALGEQRFIHEVRSVLDTDPYTIAELCDEFGLPPGSFSPLDAAA